MGGPQLATRRTLLARTHQRAKEDQGIVAGPSYHGRAKAALAGDRMRRPDHLVKWIRCRAGLSGQWRRRDRDPRASKCRQLTLAVSAKIGSTSPTKTFRRAYPNLMSCKRTVNP